MILSAIRSKLKKSKDIFGLRPKGERGHYLKLFEDAKLVSHDQVDKWVAANGPDIQAEFLEELALNTQVVIKASPPNWQHGRLLYTKLRDYLDQRVSSTFESPIAILETGTARGFSAICLSKALQDENTPGLVYTIDSIPHNYKMYWNCISDSKGKQSRAGLISSWAEQIASIVFITGNTAEILDNFHLPRIHFPFLDAQHNYKAVLAEFEYVKDRQISGDVIVFDDVTEGIFDGVVKAVREIEKDGLYNMEYIGSQSRGYAIATRG